MRSSIEQSPKPADPGHLADRAGRSWVHRAAHRDKGSFGLRGRRATSDALLTRIRLVPDPLESVMLIGHNPTFQSSHSF
jgi:hypothetical protein